MRTTLTALAAVLALLVTVAPATPAQAQQPATGARDWVPFDQATVHPGVRTVTDGSQCTANFVFTDAAGEVYLGQAAHCAGTGESSTDTDGCQAMSAPLGTAVQISGASQPGRLVYSSWLTMQAIDETDPNACRFNDLALIRIDPADHRAVNPSLPFYGGPQGIAATTSPGEKVYTFGNSSLRPGGGSAKSGTARGQAGEGWTHNVFTPNLGIPGDAGSAFIDGQGRAFGVLSTLEVFPNIGNNGVSDLSLMLAYLDARDDLSVTLAPGTLLFDANGATVDTAGGEAGEAGEDEAGEDEAGEDDAMTRRLTGPDGSSRIETAVAVSQDDFAPGAAAAVVLARSDVAADALAGTPLAAARRAPLLLTQGDNLHPATAAEIRRVLPDGGTVLLLGGPGALGPAVESALADYDVQRLAGATRIETAIAIAEATTGSPAQVLLADGSGDAFADALVSGPAAASVGGVVVLTDGGRAHPAVDAYLSGRTGAQIVTVGSAATAAYPGRTAIVGDTAQRTSVLVAQAYADGARTVSLARVDVFADALSGGAHAARAGAPLLLTDTASLTPVVRDHLTARAATIDVAVLYGGTAAISDATADQVREAIAGR
ncbi:hypothetical protein BH23ACT9_BH23ACT9_26580 [soil metagenome]